MCYRAIQKQMRSESKGLDSRGKSSQNIVLQRTVNSFVEFFILPSILGLEGKKNNKNVEINAKGQNRPVSGQFIGIFN